MTPKVERKIDMLVDDLQDDISYRIIKNQKIIPIGMLVSSL